mmetsp:Transcript_131491/g.228582  ORF Transcript_131491/g.228582 Transcript_131491/m.228582 type:complete len:80 (+) Transcript_131491:378-617(+)
MEKRVRSTDHYNDNDNYHNNDDNNYFNNDHDNYHHKYHNDHDDNLYNDHNHNNDVMSGACAELARVCKVGLQRRAWMWA